MGRVGGQNEKGKELGEGREEEREEVEEREVEEREEVWLEPGLPAGTACTQCECEA